MVAFSWLGKIVLSEKKNEGWYAKWQGLAIHGISDKGLITRKIKLKNGFLIIGVL
jgi:hypothetical protein